jgi:hypothetical protein
MTEYAFGAKHHEDTVVHITEGIDGTKALCGEGNIVILAIGAGPEAMLCEQCETIAQRLRDDGKKVVLYTRRRTKGTDPPVP